jgi:hypothetical protein
MTIFFTKRNCLNASIFCALILLLAACAGPNGKSNVPATPATGSITPTPGSISLGPQTCPVAVQAPAHWDPIIPTQAGVSHVVSVTCGYLKGVPTLQALVTVAHSGNAAILDAYVYDNITSANPPQIFKLQDLMRGVARISGYNTILTAEVDPGSSVNQDQTNSSFSLDLSREFKWSDGAGTLVQISFPGIFPDLTRYEAELDQTQVNVGTQPWKLSAIATAQEFGSTLLHWNPNAPATIVTGGGQHDVGAIVNLKSLSPGNKSIQLSMTRLEDNADGGIWIVTSAQSASVSITSPQNLGSITSPLTITGTGTAFEGMIGKVTILDHLYNPLGTHEANGVKNNGSTTFSTHITYQHTFLTGDEEGLIMLSEPNSADGSVASIAFAKVLIS